MDIEKKAWPNTNASMLNLESARFALDQHSLVSVTDLDGTIVYVNKTFCKVSGYSENELLGKKHNILNSGNQSKSYWKKMHDAVLSGSVWQDEVRNRAKSGSYYWVDTTIVPNFDHGNKVIGFTSVRTDITKQKENIEHLAQAKKDAESASQAKEDFLANMSHEIRTPMNGVYASLQLLSRNQMPLEQRELVNQSLFSCECLLTIINDILDFSKIESGQLDIESIQFGIRNTVESVLSDIMPIVDKGVKLAFSADEQVPDHWLGDPVRVKQIMLNLVSNAAKFTHDGEILIGLSPLSNESVDSGFEIIVKDTGIGMSPQALDTLFNRFSQADTSTTRKYGGTGLGMSITTSLVQLMGGDIRVQSTEGVGTEFIVSLPLKRGKEQRQAQRTIKQTTSPNLEHKTVLVADDNPINRVIIKKVLASTHATIIEVENGEQAFTLAMKHQPDIVLMDIQMPVMDGVSALRLLRDKGFSAPVVAFTANVLKHDVERYIEQGFDDCISKPVDFDIFYKVLGDLVLKNTRKEESLG